MIKDFHDFISFLPGLGLPRNRIADFAADQCDADGGKDRNFVFRKIRLVGKYEGIVSGIAGIEIL